jgi:hypothetical protein
MKTSRARTYIHLIVQPHSVVAGYVFAYVSPMWLSVATILALGAAASPVSLEAAAGFEAVASKLAGQPSKLPDVVKSRLKLVKLHCAVLTNRPHSRGLVRTCTRVTCLLRTERIAVRRKAARPAGSEAGARAPHVPRTVAHHRYCSTDEQSLHKTPVEKVDAAKRGPCQARPISIGTHSV